MAEIRVSECQDVKIEEQSHAYINQERLEGPFKIIYLTYDNMKFALVLNLSEGKWVSASLEHMSNDRTCPLCNEKHYRQCSKGSQYKDRLLEEIKELRSFRLTALFEL